tara:strand:- start:3636 stop:3842 length:207 start_codon:yes stop_codon:yes gene_type:complete
MCEFMPCIEILKYAWNPAITVHIAAMADNHKHHLETINASWAKLIFKNFNSQANMSIKNDITINATVK